MEFIHSALCCIVLLIHSWDVSATLLGHETIAHDSMEQKAMPVRSQPLTHPKIAIVAWPDIAKVMLSNIWLWLAQFQAYTVSHGPSTTALSQGCRVVHVTTIIITWSVFALESSLQGSNRLILVWPVQSYFTDHPDSTQAQVRTMFCLSVNTPTQIILTVHKAQVHTV